MLKNMLTRLTVALAVISLAACNEAVLVGDGYGSIGVSLDWDTALQTKADGAVELGDDTQVTISVLDEDGDVVVEPTTYAYAALKEAEFEVPVGVYTVTASTGSNHQAAWGSPFYYGEDEVTVYAERSNAAEIVCTLANVKVTVAFDEGFADYCSYYGVTVDNGAGEGLTFSNENGKLDEEGYFAVTGSLKWKLILENNDGKSYIASGNITNVKAKQHYPLSFTLSEAVEDEKGSSVFKITLDDSITEKEFDAVLDFSPSGSYDVITSGFDYVAGNIAVPMGDENVKTITTSMTNGIASAPVCVDGKWYELVNADQTTIDRLAAIGVGASVVNYGATSFTIDVTDYLAGIGEFGDYPVTVAAYDVKGLKVETVFAFEIISNVDASAVSAVPSATSAVLTAKWYSSTRPEGLGIEYKTVSGTEWTQVDAAAITYDETQKRFSANVTGLAAGTQYSFRPYSVNHRDEISTMDFYTNFTAPVSVEPWAKFAVVTGKWLTDTRPDGLSFKYRVYGTTGWVDIDSSKSRMTVDDASKTFTADITGLDPDCPYEFRAISSVDADSNQEIVEFRTEKAGTIYNMNFDEWSETKSNNKTVYYPFAEGAQHVWDSANEAAVTLSQSSTTPVSGSDAYKGKAVRMESKYMLIAFAAGNLFTGDFVTIDGVGAELDWGVQFTSRPVALKGYYKYIPAKIDKLNEDKLKAGGLNPSDIKGTLDKAQIQAFTANWDKQFRINTTAGQFVDVSENNRDNLVAFGRLESSDTHESYHEFVIPLTYRSKEAPTYVVISAAASYLGDYFTGGVGSVLYVDEFEFIYDIAELTDEEAASVNYR